MNARPILFSAPMIRALLAGTKTQTRRLLKPQPEVSGDGWISWGDLGECAIDCFASSIVEDCPYGTCGDLLWARETWQRHIGPYGESFVYAYKATDDDRAGPWRPSIYMPRETSRITLRITGVRVERLQSISEADAIAEGIERIDDPRGIAWKSYEVIHAGKHHGQPHPHAAVPNKSPITSYRELWESINGPASWASNPWVWVIVFETIRANVDDVMRKEAA